MTKHRKLFLKCLLVRRIILSMIFQRYKQKFIDHSKEIIYNYEKMAEHPPLFPLQSILEFPTTHLFFIGVLSPPETF